MVSIKRYSSTVLLCVPICALTAFAGEGELGVFHTSAGQLVGHSHAPQPIPLEPSIFPGIEGFATGLIGFHSEELDDPEEDLFALPEPADIQAILHSSSPGFIVHDGAHELAIGEAMYFGHPFFDYHPVFNITHGEPDEIFTITFVFHDRAGLFGDSEPFSISFTPASIHCIADFNHDGGIDGADVESFFAEWESGGHHADVNQDGGVDGADVEVFFAEWESGACE